MTRHRMDEAQSARLRAILMRWRRRQRLVTFASCSLIVAAVLSGVAVPLFVTMPAHTVTRASAALASIGLAGAIVVAIARTPAPRRVAALADSRLHLDDHLVTALQFADDPDDLSQLIVREAVARTHLVSPSDVFPLRALRGTGWSAVAALAASTLVALITTRPSVFDVVRPYRQTAAATSAAGPTTDANARSGGAAAPASGKRDRASQQGLQEPPGPDKSMTAAQSDDRERGGDRAGALASPSQRDAPVEKPGRPANAIPVPTADAPFAESVVSLPTAPGSPAKSGSATGTAAQRGAAAHGAGGTARSALTDNAGSGGSPGPGIVRRTAPRTVGGDKGYSASSARAEAALATGRIPPGLRAYLKTYFNAIGPR
jgi:hypothetical protein